MKTTTEAEALRYLAYQLECLENIKEAAIYSKTPADSRVFVDAYDRISEARSQLAKVQGKV